MSNVLAGKVALATVQSADQHREVVDVATTKRPHVLMVVANPTTATTTGWPVGFWASELTHPYYEFTRANADSWRGSALLRGLGDADNVGNVGCKLGQQR